MRGLLGPGVWALVRSMGPARGSRLLAQLAGAQKTDVFQEADRRARDWLKTKLSDETTLAMCGHFHLAAHEHHESGEVVTLAAGGGPAAVWLVDGAVVRHP